MIAIRLVLGAVVVGFVAVVATLWESREARGSSEYLEV